MHQLFAPIQNAHRPKLIHRALKCSVARSTIAVELESSTSAAHFEAFVGGAWRVVPDDKVIRRSDNPTALAVVCWTPRTGILCFVRAPES